MNMTFCLLHFLSVWFVSVLMLLSAHIERLLDYVRDFCSWVQLGADEDSGFLVSILDIQKVILIVKINFYISKYGLPLVTKLTTIQVFDSTIQTCGNLQSEIVFS